MKLDILTRLRLPEGFGKVGVLVNIESQVDYYPGYPLVYRALMYTAKILSMQPGWLFKGDDYGKLEKVYSIWIITNPPRKHRNKVINIGMHNWISVPNGNNESYSCDLVEMIFVHLGEQDSELSRVIGILDTMMYGNMSLAERVRVLTEDYKFEVDELMRRGIDSMTSLYEQAEHASYMRGAYDVALNTMISLIREKGWSFEESVDFMISKDWDPQLIKDLKMELRERLEE